MLYITVITTNSPIMDIRANMLWLAFFWFIICLSLRRRTFHFLKHPKWIKNFHNYFFDFILYTHLIRLFNIMLSPEVWIIHLFRKMMWWHIYIIHPNLSFFAALFSHYIRKNPLRGGSKWGFLVYYYTLYWEHYCSTSTS